MLGGWQLFTADAIKWPAGSIKVVAVDALPSKLVYVKNGYVDTRPAQDCYGWETQILSSKEGIYKTNEFLAALKSFR